MVIIIKNQKNDEYMRFRDATLRSAMNSKKDLKILGKNDCMLDSKNERLVCNAEIKKGQFHLTYYPMPDSLPKNVTIKWVRSTPCGDQFHIYNGSISLFPILNTRGRFQSNQYEPAKLCEIAHMSITNLRRSPQIEIGAIPFVHCAEYRICKQNTMQWTKNTSEYLLADQRVKKFFS